MTENTLSRREQILQALALMLEEDSGKRITTSALARQVGVSEAALYRHFPSKARMFEGLIEFIESTLFERIQRILAENHNALMRLEKIIQLVLVFAEKNPGLSRLMDGDILTGETARLRLRMSQLFDRLETQFKQILREAEFRESLRAKVQTSASANLLSALIEGRISQYVRSDYRLKPTTHIKDQWTLIATQLFVETPAVVEKRQRA